MYVFSVIYYSDLHIDINNDRERIVASNKVAYVLQCSHNLLNLC